MDNRHFMSHICDDRHNIIYARIALCDILPCREVKNLNNWKDEFTEFEINIAMEKAKILLNKQINIMKSVYPNFEVISDIDFIFDLNMSGIYKIFSDYMKIIFKDGKTYCPIKKFVIAHRDILDGNYDFFTISFGKKLLDVEFINLSLDGWRETEYEKQLVLRKMRMKN